ncbi:MAG: ATP-dependent DNA helicase [Xanthomonadales bacterium]|nr:ATP-dependent DNA helicase [Xanthomonadales bacterium]
MSGSEESGDARRLLGESGPFATHLSGFRIRQGQQNLAEAIETAIAERATLVAEAGTGIGKTFAYLTPVLTSGAKALISTGTKTLQDQLFERDLPAISEVLGIRPRTALLKGRANYLCLYRLDRARRESGKPSPAMLRLFDRLDRWSAETRSGDLSEFGDAETGGWQALVTSTSENCLGQECPFFEDCFLVQARHRAMAADVVVVNHHLLFADMALKRDGFGELLPEADVVVIDEAHRVPETATLFFGQSLSSRMLRDLADDVLRESGEVPGGLGVVQAPVDQLRQSAKVFRLALERLPPRGSWVNEGPAAEALNQVRDALDVVASALSGLAEASPGTESCWRRTRAHLDRLAAIEAGDPDFIAWYEAAGRGFSLHLSPVEIAEEMRGYRSRTEAAWVFTSATLAADGRFDLFNRRLGLDDPQCLKADSPFDYARRALLFQPSGMPDPSASDFVDRLLAAVVPVLSLTDGGAFLLFTSHRNLRYAAVRLKNMGRWPLLVQGEDSRHRLLERFKQTPGALLLGAASFWEGVDVVGDSLRCVVIDKLPFSSPDDPILQGRIRRIREAGGDPFREEQLPQAVLTLKQGFGRLIRSESDYGIVVIGDPRLTSRGYGRVFLRSLPDLPLVSDLEAVAQFLNEQHCNASAPF